MKKQSGITLIALVISIIVMLILSGVSINAIVGEDGIISKAQNSTYLQSVAVLEEYLQMEYSNYALDETERYNTPLDLLKAKYSGWFFQTLQGYVVDSSGHALYLINKENLPEDIRNQLKGGNAKQITEFYAQKDVYGVTSDLMVYYCKNGTDTIMGLTIEDLDADNPLEEAYPSDSPLAEILNGGESALSNQDLKSVKELVIDDNDKVAILAELKNLPSLKTLTLKGITAENLTGIERANSLVILNIQSCTIGDYTAIAGCTKLTSLYFIDTTDDEIETFTDSETGVGGKEIPVLDYFGIYNSGVNVTDISGLANLGASTQARISHIYLYNNKLTSISALSGYTGCTYLNVQDNSTLTTLAGITGMSQLEYIYAKN